MMSDFKNLYQLLDVSPIASVEEIRKAMRSAAESQRIELADLQLCRQILLDLEARKKYNAKLFKEYPELLENLVESKKEPIEEISRQVRPSSAIIQPKEVETEKVDDSYEQNFSEKLKGWFSLKSILLIAVVLIIGFVGYNMYNKPVSIAKAAVRDGLKDPDSAKFYDLKRYKDKDGDNKCTSIAGYYNARTPAGGYGGKKRFAYDCVERSVIFISDEKPDNIFQEMLYSRVWRVFYNHESKKDIDAANIQILTNLGKMNDAEKNIEMFGRKKAIMLVNDEYELAEKTYDKKIADLEKEKNGIMGETAGLIERISIYP